MRRLILLSRFLLPATFLCYALIANVNFLRTGQLSVDLSQIAVIKGRTASQIDAAYVDSLPHRDISIGLIGAARYLLIGEGRSGVIAGRKGWLFTEEEARPFADWSAQAALQVAGVQQRLAQSGATLILVPVPGKLDVYSGNGPEGSVPGIRTAYDQFLDTLRAADIPVVDTRAALAHRALSAQTFLATDTHWSPDGAAQVADLIAGSGLIPAGKTEFSPRNATPKTLTGDLVSFVTSDGLAPLIGLAPETVTPFDAVAGATGPTDIFGGDVIDTVLIGTSYSANPNWSFAESLKLALSRDVLNLAQEGQGPVAPMRAYLAGADLADTPPRYVLWEFPVRYLSDPALWDAPVNTGEGA